MGLPPQYTDLRILVAEDDPISQRVVDAMLESLGVHATIVGHGAAALAQVERAPFDLILMDLDMPVMDGLTAIEKIRALEARTRRERTPIYVISAMHDPSDLRASVKAGADGHLPKPLRIHLLLYAVAHGLKHRLAGASAERPMPFGQSFSADAAGAQALQCG
jgi:CheY-like chemotaxis protein